MAPRRAGTGSGSGSRRPGSPGGRRRVRRVRECVLDRRGRREEERRLSREMEDLLQRGRQLGKTAFTHMLWQAINFGVEDGVLQLYTGPLPNQSPRPPPPAVARRRRIPAPTPRPARRRAPQRTQQPPPPPPLQEGVAECLNCRSGVPSTRQVEETAAGCAGVTRVAFHSSPLSDSSDAVTTAYRGGASPAKVGVVRRVLSYVLYPFKLMMWPLSRRRPSVSVMELPDAAAAAAAAATPMAAATPGTSGAPTPPLSTEGRCQPGVSGCAAAAGEPRAVPAEGAAVAAAAAAPQGRAGAARRCRCCCHADGDGGCDTGDSPGPGPSPPPSTEVAYPCQLQQRVKGEGEGEGAGRSADDSAVVDHQDQLAGHPDPVPGCSFHLDK